MNCFKWRFNKMHYFGVLMGLNGPRAIKAEKGKRTGDSLAILREGFMPTNESFNLWKSLERPSKDEGLLSWSCTQTRTSNLESASSAGSESSRRSDLNKIEVVLGSANY